jgi:hypothetical protein
VWLLREGWIRHEPEPENRSRLALVEIVAPLHHHGKSKPGKSHRLCFSPVSQIEDQQRQFPAYLGLAPAFVRERFQGSIEGPSHRLQQVRIVKVIKSGRFVPLAAQLLQIATVIDWDMRYADMCRF